MEETEEKEIKDPVIKKLIEKRVIAKDEKVLYSTTQKRWYKLIWPGWVIVTGILLPLFI